MANDPASKSEPLQPTCGRSQSTFSRVGVLRLSLTVFFLLFYLGYIAVLFVSGGQPGGDLLLYVILGGMLGGAVDLSRQIPLISRQKSVYSVLSVVIWKLMVSGVLAVFVYCSFAGGIIQGALFPEFREGGRYTGMEGFLGGPTGVGPKTNLDAAKVLVWSFVAGYSEKFITGVLYTLDKQSEQHDQGMGEE